MTPELLRDMRVCAERIRFQAEFFTAEFWQSYHDTQAEEAAERVLAWLDAQEHLHTPIMPMDENEEVDTEYVGVKVADVDMDDWEYAYTSSAGSY